MNQPAARDLLFEAIDTIQNDRIRCCLRHIFHEHADKFLAACGGKGRHHAFKGGLAYHSTHAAFLAGKIVDHYHSLGIEVNKDIVIAGTLLHDIGKMECYEYDKDLLQDPGRYDVIIRGGWKKTKADQMFHHIPIGYGIVLEGTKSYNRSTPSPHLYQIKQEDIDHLLHIVLSHHGNKCWSSPVIPQTTEAYIVHSIEMMDGYVDSYSKGNIPQEIYSH